MATKSKESSGGTGLMDGLPTDELKEQARDLVTAMGERAVAVATDKLGGLTGRISDYADGSGEGGSGSLVGSLLGSGASTVKDKVKDKVKDTFGGGSDGKSGGSGKGDKSKLTNIIEQVEVGVPVRVAYNQWTQFQDFPQFTKRIESVNQESEEKISWKAGIYFSHRTWTSTIVEQIPDERIVWHSEGEKGYVDGTVTFHDITPDLTKILLVLEYHAQGLFERTGNAFRAQRRRARLELNHFARHVMTQTILDQDVEGWRGEIRDSEVVRSHEEGLEDDEAEDQEYADAENEPGEEDDEHEDEYEDEYEDEEAEDDEDVEDNEDNEDDEYEDVEDEDEEAEDDEPDEDEDEDEDDEKASGRTATRSRRRQPARSR